MDKWRVISPDIGIQHAGDYLPEFVYEVVVDLGEEGGGETVGYICDLDEAEKLVIEHNWLVTQAERKPTYDLIESLIEMGDYDAAAEVIDKAELEWRLTPELAGYQSHISMIVFLGRPQTIAEKIKEFFARRG